MKKIALSALVLGCMLYADVNIGALATGQTKSYDAFRENNATATRIQIPDDGYFKSGKARSFTRNGDMVTDSATGIVWQDDGGAPKLMLVGDAKTYCKDLRLGGYSDWRLPSMKELLSIIDSSRLPSVDPIFKNIPQDRCWSSSIVSYGPWVKVVNMYDGTTSSNGKSYAAVCVRAGQ